VIRTVRRTIALAALCAAGLALALPSSAAASPATGQPGAAKSAAGPTAVPVPIGAGPAALESRRQALAAADGITASAINCWVNVSIKRYGLSTWVSMENDFTGNRQYELRARATAVGPWELFSVCRDQSTGATNFVSQKNNRYVTAEKDYTGPISGMLRARTSSGSVGTWEIFRTDVDPGNGYCTHIWAQANGLFVTAEQNYSGNDKGMLRARTAASALGTWELFCW
jgi:hypothetical protein